MTTVAQTILAQLGGRRFLAMTGARNCVGSDTDLAFRLPGTPGFVKRGINVVRITLTWRDTYTVVFSRLFRGTLTEVITLEEVYAEDLQAAFTRETGLDTHLSKEKHL